MKRPESMHCVTGRSEMT